MTRIRCMVSAEAIRGSRVVVRDPQEIHHILRVLRARIGDRVECLDGRGSRYEGSVIRCARREIVIGLDHRGPEEVVLPLQLTLAQALIRAERFEWLIQKATELGVTRVAPLMTKRTVIRPMVERSEHKLLRWRRIAKEASKQCGRPNLPSIDPPQPLEGFLPTLQGSDALIATLSGEPRPLAEALKPMRTQASLAILIGPEGDFTREEVACAERCGALPVSLGSLTLRSETAALAMLAIVRYALKAL